MLNVIIQKFSIMYTIVMNFSIFILCKLSKYLLDCNYSTSLVDLTFSNCKVIERSNDWSLFLFKEAFHIRRLNPVLNHGARVHWKN